VTSLSVDKKYIMLENARSNFYMDFWHRKFVHDKDTMSCSSIIFKKNKKVKK